MVREGHLVETGLVRNHDWYRCLLEVLPHPIQECDVDGIITYASPANQEISGYAPEELMGTPIWERLVLEEERGRLRDYLQFILKEKPAPVAYHAIEHAKDGRRIHLQIDWRYRCDETGKVVGFVSCLTDITHQVAAERELKLAREELENRVRERTFELQSIYDAIVDGVLIVDVLHDRVLHVNRAAERIIGYTMQELASVPYSRVVPPARSLSVIAKLKAIQDGTLKVAQSLPCVRKDGSEIRVDVTGGSIRFQGVPAAIFFLREESDRNLLEDLLRDAEKRLPQLAGNMREVFWLCDPVADKVLYVTPSYEQLWGRSREEVYESADRLCHAVHPADRRKLLRHLRGKDSAISANQKFRIVRPDGSVRWIQNRNFPIRDAKGCVHRVVRISEDVTETMEKERAMQRSERLASLGTLAAGIAHEINNPIGAALLAAQTALAVQGEANAAPVVADCLKNIVDAMDRCGRIVRNILRLSRDEPRERSWECINDIVRHAIDMSRESIRKRGVQVFDALDANLPKLFVNGMEVELVLLNLIRNALDAKAENVWMGTTESVEYVRIVVEDDGEGLTDDQCARVFDPFFTGRKNEGGTGLGLSIAHRIVADHQGQIFVKRRSPRGARAVVEFPKGNPTSEDSPPSSVIEADSRMRNESVR
ncbi:MAG: PAS domain S-box protein [Planctomycetota bacterium]